jgi:hypothetical protein
LGKRSAGIKCNGLRSCGVSKQRRNGNCGNEYAIISWCQYDLTDRLVQVAKDGITVASYLYDEFGLRLEKTGTGGMTPYVFDINGKVLYEQENRDYFPALPNRKAGPFPVVGSDGTLTSVGIGVAGASQAAGNTLAAHDVAKVAYSGAKLASENNNVIGSIVEKTGEVVVKAAIGVGSAVIAWGSGAVDAIGDAFVAAKRQVFKKYPTRKKAQDAVQRVGRSQDKKTGKTEGPEQHDKGGPHYHDKNHNDDIKPNVHYEYPK